MSHARRQNWMLFDERAESNVVTITTHIAFWDLMSAGNRSANFFFASTGADITFRKVIFLHPIQKLQGRKRHRTPPRKTIASPRINAINNNDWKTFFFLAANSPRKKPPSSLRISGNIGGKLKGRKSNCFSSVSADWIRFWCYVSTARIQSWCSGHQNHSSPSRWTR